MADDEADRGEGICTLAVHMAAPGAFTDDEIKSQIFDPLREKLREEQAATPGATVGEIVDRSSAKLMIEKIGEAQTKELFDYHYEKAIGETKQEVRQRVAAGMNYVEAVRSAIGGAEKGYGSGNSADALRSVMRTRFMQPLEMGLRRVPGLINRFADWALLRGETGFTRDVIRQLAAIMGDTSIEQSKDEAVIVAAESLKAALVNMRKELNGVGAMIRHLDGYVGRQNHDKLLVAGGFWRELRVLTDQNMKAAQAGGLDLKGAAQSLNWDGLRSEATRRAFRKWYEFTLPKLLPETFKDVTWADLTAMEPGAQYRGPTFTEGEHDPAALDAQARRELQGLYMRRIADDPTDMRQLFMYRVWQHITSGRGELGGVFAEHDFVPNNVGFGYAKQKARVLRFKTDDWLDYAKEYTKGSPIGNIVAQINRGAATYALLKRFSPDPERGIKDIVQSAYKDARDAGENPARYEGLINGNAVSSSVQAEFDVLSGAANIPVSLRLAELFKVLRSWQQMTKLGSVPLSKTVDYSYGSNAVVKAGADVMQAHSLWLQNALHGAEQKDFARILGASTEAFGGRLFAAISDEGRPGWTTWGVRMIHQLSGFVPLNEHFMGTTGLAVTQFHGGLAHLAFDALPERVQDVFNRFSITPADWDLIREGAAPLRENGATYVTMDKLHERVANDPHLYQQANDAETKYEMLVHSMMADAINEPRIREQAITRAPGSLFGASGPTLRPGTVEGEVMASLMQFKQFTMSTWGRHTWPALRAGNVGQIVNLMITGAAMGYLTMALKQLSRGEVPRSAADVAQQQGISELEAMAHIWGAAMAQGGGLGVMGDFLFGEMDRNGQDFSWASMGGPMMSQSEQVLKIVREAISGGGSGRHDVMSDIAKFAAGNIPIVNVWYTRLAIDYLLMWRLQEMNNPGYLERYQDRMQKQNGTQYWLAPTSAA